IRVGSAIGRDVFLETIGAAQWLGDGRVVADVVAVDQFVDDLQVPFPGFLEQAADDRFVLFRGHTSPFLGAGADAATLRHEGGDRSCSQEKHRDMRSEGAALALTLRASKTDFSLPPPTLQAIYPCSSNAPEPSRCRPQSAIFFRTSRGVCAPKTGEECETYVSLRLRLCSTHARSRRDDRGGRRRGRAVAWPKQVRETE